MISALLINVLSTVYCQDTYNRQLKYWYLRDRLRYFIIKDDFPLNVDGSYMVMTSRNRDLMGSNGFGTTADFGQESAMYGKYLGVLATEYYLLKQYGQDQEAEITDQELQKALLAQRRRDLWESHLGSGYGSVENGLFCRHDFPPDEGGSPPNAFIHSHSEINTYAGVLHSTDPILENGAIRVVDNLGNSLDPNYCLYQQMSQDEAIFTFEGLALAYHFGSPEAAALARSLAEKILIRCYGKWKDVLSCFDWIIYGYNNTTPVPDGPFCASFSYGYMSVSAYFNLFPMMPQAGTWDYWNWGCYNGIPGSSTEHHMVASLAAIGNFWGNSMSQQAIYNNSDGGMNWREYYLWLHGALQDYHNPFGSFGVENVEDRLDEAPCVGPWKENDNNHAPNGWASNDRWYHTQDEQNDGNFVTGAFSGLDYMMLLNLYYICNVVGSPGAEYLNHVNSILDAQWPQGIKGSTLQPYIVNAFRSIISTENVLTTQYAGDVEYHAGEEITLTPGFNAVPGSFFEATIHPMAYCGEGDSPTKQSLVSLKGSVDSGSSSFSNWSINNVIEKSDKLIIHVYPNPTSGIIKIVLAEKIYYQLILENETGTELLRMSGSEQNVRLSLTDFKNGIFIIKIITSYETIIKKIIKI